MSVAKCAPSEVPRSDESVRQGKKGLRVHFLLQFEAFHVSIATFPCTHLDLFCFSTIWHIALLSVVVYGRCVVQQFAEEVESIVWAKNLSMICFAFNMKVCLAVEHTGIAMQLRLGI